MIWSKRVAEAITAVSSEKKGSDFELWVLGALSKQASEEFKKQGWKVHTGAGSKLVAARK